MSDVAACYKCNSSEYGSMVVAVAQVAPVEAAVTFAVAAIVSTVAVVAEDRSLDNYYL